MKYDKYGRPIDKDYLKYHDEEYNIHLLFKGAIYKSIKQNEQKCIIMNIDNNILYSISWCLFGSLEWFRTLEEAKEQQKKHYNVFKEFNLKWSYGETDIYNYEPDEQPKQLINNKTNMKHYKQLGLNIETNYKVFQTART